MYGIRGTTWRQPGCFATVLIVLAAISLAPIASGLLGSLILWVWRLTTTPETVDVAMMYLSIFAVFAGGFVWAGFRIHRHLTARTVFWCPRCGVTTDPRFEICRACGRVKSHR
ncbi:hypothetical protein SAMN04489860_0852 [Paraoerskovia marina]|uniref:Uncharacterized protein n=1 Tax=Paraoerskovia marina TaxID=545619 RepID=A0A1H1PMJ5_9CELL|nr:hypothetical protein SAMN04489860_0852 [Paraoerskovia marina]